MAIIVETGSIVTSANSYVTEAELTTYSAARGVTIANGDREKYLTLAMDFIETLDFKGIKYTKLQALQWPRVDVVVDTYLIDADEIPTDLKNAQLHTAMAISEGNSPVAIVERKTTTEQVGSLSVTYANSSASNPIDPKISRYLRKLVNGGLGGFMVTKA
jgi:hypothetical protein